VFVGGAQLRTCCGAISRAQQDVTNHDCSHDPPRTHNDQQTIEPTCQSTAVSMPSVCLKPVDSANFGQHGSPDSNVGGPIPVRHHVYPPQSLQHVCSVNMHNEAGHVRVVIQAWSPVNSPTPSQVQFAEVSRQSMRSPGRSRHSLRFSGCTTRNASVVRCAEPDERLRSPGEAVPTGTTLLTGA
jgi:hypothetical protein